MSKPAGGLGRGLGALLQPSSPSQEESKETLSVIAGTSSPQGQETISGPFKEVDASLISVNPHQPRRHFAPDELEDLIGSVREHGILQPLVVTDRGDGTFELIAGERRLRSAREVGLKKVPVIIREADEQQKLELAIIENVQRADLNAIEEALAYEGFAKHFNFTQQQIADRVGKSRSYVANIMRLLDLDAHMQQALIEGKISRSHARTLLAESNGTAREELFQQMLSGKVTVRQAEAKAHSPRRRSSSQKDPNIAALEKELRESLGTKVSISMNGASGKVTIHVYSREELKDLISVLKK